MKGLTDYVGEEAVDLWADILDPVGDILSDKEVAKVVKSNVPRIKVVTTILKRHKKEATEILQRIDPTPVNALNMVTRLASLITEIGNQPELQSFFGFTARAKMQEESSTSPTESTGDEEK